MCWTLRLSILSPVPGNLLPAVLLTNRPLLLKHLLPDSIYTNSS